MAKSPRRPLAAATRGIADLEPLETTTLHVKVYNSLARALMSGAFRPGEVLSYQRLADQFGVSPMPVRDALRHLAAEGAVEIAPKRGVRIPAASVARVEELTSIRLPLEGLATEQAASRLPKRALLELEQLARAIVTDGERGDTQSYLARNYEFHFGIYRASNSPLLVRLIEGLWLQTGPLMTQFGDNAMRDEPSLHDDVLSAIRDAEPGRARRLMEADIEHGMLCLQRTVGRLAA